MANSRHPDKRCISCWVDKDLFLGWQKECAHVDQTMTERVTVLLTQDFQELTRSRVAKAKRRGAGKGR